MIDIDFGDSEEEEEGEGQRSTVSSKGVNSLTAVQAGSSGSRGAVGGRRGGREEVRREEELDDEGFCILNSPTSTYVVRVHMYVYVFGVFT